LLGDAASTHCWTAKRIRAFVFLVAVELVGHLQQHAGVQQVHLGDVGGRRIRHPLLPGEASIRLGRRIRLRVREHLVPECGRLGEVVVLQLQQRLRRQAQPGQRPHRIGQRGGERSRLLRQFDRAPGFRLQLGLHLWLLRVGARDQRVPHAAATILFA
jgi:hypothetical protein